MIIRVSPQDFARAADVGVRRVIARILAGKMPNGTTSHDDDPVFEQAIIGAVAEQEVARLLNLFWDHKIGDDTAGDVGGCVEVRCRNPRSGDEIGLHKHAKDMTPYVGVLYLGGFNFEITGWVRGREGRERGKWVESRHCWFVPRPYFPFAELIALFGTNSAMAVA